MITAPRITPGTTAQIGRMNTLIARVIGLAGGTGRPPNLFTTLARHRRLFRPWLRFAGRLMPGGALPRVDSELLILRVAHNCECEYEWRHHERIGVSAGLSKAQIEAVRAGAGAPDFDRRQALLLRAADELHDRREISDELWSELSARLLEVELIELCMLVGHYEMLAMTLNSLRVVPDTFNSGPPSRIMRLLGAR
jgi:alkylhydroperoxidase family enzyme